MSSTVDSHGDFHVTDSLGRKARFHWSRFHGLIVSADSAVYVTQDKADNELFFAWLNEVAS